MNVCSIKTNECERVKKKKKKKGREKKKRRKGARIYKRGQKSSKKGNSAYLQKTGG